MSRRDIDPGSIHTLFNLELTNANQEYSQVIAKATIMISIQCRTNVEIRFSMTQGGVDHGDGNLYQTIKAGAEKYQDMIYLEDQETLYFWTESTTSPVVEIEVWRANY